MKKTYIQPSQKVYEVNPSLPIAQSQLQLNDEVGNNVQLIKEQVDFSDINLFED